MYGQLGGDLGAGGTGGAGGAALAGELAASARELDALRVRVENEVASLPRIDVTGWSGPASRACQLALALLRREAEAARELLACASDLAAAAAFEAGRNG